jgi:hypothetical protein
MSRADEYRKRAIEFRAQAQSARTPEVKNELNEMAIAYLRLAEVADRNSTSDIVYEPPPRKLNEG